MTIFSKIIAGEIPSYKIAEDEQFLAFLDVFPLVKGHVLVVPKMEIDKIFDLPDEVLIGHACFCKANCKGNRKNNGLSPLWHQCGGP